ncbi:peritrophic membrane chitin binding [Chlorella sorokiniana]|uniref:Peritrophic membrane chitin binding n=1 Tax=Chlorella sorokiniana TaxID=3076 RepID=A0A2P6TFP8_CHLSO|nr:peritrophic membrane chitin binding [Chlorella sorokiniana]|eukprot:PRW32927.1 peritrophic membrane chitin binding [Chlorella sorokiniana]
MTMDYGENCPPAEQDCLFNLLAAHFDAAYAGNRAPMPLFIHTPHLANATRLRQYQKFVDYALGKSDVWPVTMQQLRG